MRRVYAETPLFKGVVEAPSPISRPRPDRLDPGTVLDGSKPPIEVAARPGQSRTVVLPRSLFDPTIKVPASVYKVATFLNDECDRFTDIHGEWQVGVWTSPYEIGKVVGLAESTVRDTALRWLQEHNEVMLQEILGPDGRVVATVIWLKWRGPGAFEGMQLAVRDPDAGACSRVTEQAPTARKPLRESAPSVKSRIPGEDKKTTTDGGRSSSFSSPTLPEQEPPPIQATPIDPGIAEALAHHVPDLIERAELEACVPKWVAKHPVAWVILAIAAMAANRARPGVVIRANLSSYLAGIMANWAKVGEPSVKVAAGSQPPEEFLARKRAAEAAKEREAAEAKRREAEATKATQARDAADKARWERMDPALKEPIIARVKAANPTLPPKFLGPYYIQAMLEMETRP